MFYAFSHLCVCPKCNVTVHKELEQGSVCVKMPKGEQRAKLEHELAGNYVICLQSEEPLSTPCDSFISGDKRSPRKALVRVGSSGLNLRAPLMTV